MIGSVRAEGAKLAISGVVDLSELAAASAGVAKIVLEFVQELLLKLAFQMARRLRDTAERQRQGVELAKAAGKYTGHAPDLGTHCSSWRFGPLDRPSNRLRS